MVLFEIVDCYYCYYKNCNTTVVAGSVDLVKGLPVFPLQTPILKDLELRCSLIQRSIL